MQGRVGRYVLIFLSVLFVAFVAALAISIILGVERGSRRDHNSLCLMVQDEARAEGRRVLPCGSEVRP
jgi:hypothetical protein